LQGYPVHYHFLFLSFSLVSVVNFSAYLSSTPARSLLSLSFFLFPISHVAVPFSLLIYEYFSYRLEWSSLPSQSRSWVPVFAMGFIEQTRQLGLGSFRIGRADGQTWYGIGRLVCV
jgi:hypothetical protein